MAHLFFFLMSVLSILSNVISGEVVTAKSCRPSLPVEWFIHNAKTISMECFSQDLQKKFLAASNQTASAINTALTKLTDIDAISVVVAGPWGHVSDHHVGKLRFNDTADHRTVDGDSIYRIASISKVSHS